MTAPRLASALAGLASALGAAALSAAATPASAPPQGGPDTVMLYHATGVIDEGNLATTFHCTNLGATAATNLRVVVFEGDGTVDCSITMASLASIRTATLSTTSTTIFNEDAVCAPTPVGGFVRGAARIVADLPGSLDIVCTAEILDGTGSPPLFVEKLDLYDAALHLVGTFIFLDSFESGDVGRWSADVP